MAYCAPRVVFLGSILIGLFVACSSGDSTPSSPYPTTSTPGGRTETVVAQQTVGANGGSVSGGGATLDIPAGALGADTTITIKTLTPTSVTLPPSSPGVAGAIYAFTPDDLEFAKPVTITIALDPAKKPASPSSVVVLFRSPTGANQWEARGGTFASASEVKAVTTHFSDWAPSASPVVACVANSVCGADGSAGGPVGIDCRFPASGGGVHCAGSQPPYACTCDGKSDVLLTIETLPTPEELGTLATACGAACPPPPDGSTTPSPSPAVCPNVGIDAGAGTGCESISPTCADGHVYAFSCPPSGSCACSVDDKPTKTVTSDCGGAWDACGFPARGNIAPADGGTGNHDASSGGDAASASDSASQARCPPTGEDASPGTCESQSAACSDGNVYYAQCTGSSCVCSVNGGPFTMVTADCATMWTACGFPPQGATS